MEIQIGIAKVNKYASTESGDTLEVTERPNGGLSVVLADGQSSGRGAKAVANQVVRRVISLLAEGVRDGAAARAASDTLYSERNGRVSATLNILSVDFQTSTIVISRNNPCPVFIAREETIDSFNAESGPVGTSRNIRPSICEIALQNNLTVVMYTDGLAYAGDRVGRPMDMRTAIGALLEDSNPPSQEVANLLLDQAIRLDDGRPSDDMSIVVLRVTSGAEDNIRRMTVRLPVQPLEIKNP